MTLHLALLLLLAPAAQAQRDTSVDQAQLAPEDAALAVPQLSEPGRQILAPPPPTATPLPSQLTERAQSRERATQLTAERRSAPAPAQLSRTGTAEQPTPLSRPSEGRTAAVTPVTGRDRCDPARGPAPPRGCDRVIETRAAEFARPNPLTLSPEQRLLVDQRLRDATATSRSPVVRPADAAAADPDSPESQAVAALVRGQTRPDDAKSPTDAVPAELPAAAAAVIEAILGNAGVQQSAPPR